MDRLRKKPAPLKSCLSSVSEHDTRSTNTSDLKKSVSFHQVEIREYERIPGDNPAVTSGPAVSMAWSHHSNTSLDCIEYEDSRPPRRIPAEFQMPASVRKTLLEKSGASSTDIQKSQAEIRITKRHRQATAAMQELESAEILFQSIGRKWKRLINGVSQQQEQDLLWKNANNLKQETAEKEETSTDPTADQTQPDERETEC